MTTPRHIDADWKQSAQLRNGTPVVLRPVRPEDKGLFREAFARLSLDSRYRRFFTPKTRLSERDLRYLTEVDGERHFALGATRGEAEDEQGLGVARFVRPSADADVAEAAVVVTDDVHRQGLGQLLLGWLVVAARERGVEYFECDVMGENTPVLALLRDHSDGVQVTPGQDGTLRVRLKLSDVPPPDAAQPTHEGGLFQLLRLAGAEALEVRHRLEALGSRLLGH